MTKNKCIIRVGKTRTKISTIDAMNAKGYPVNTYRTASKMVVGIPCGELAIEGSSPPVCSKHLTELLHSNTVLQDIRKKPGTLAGTINGATTGNLFSLANHCQEMSISNDNAGNDASSVVAVTQNIEKLNLDSKNSINTYPKNTSDKNVHNPIVEIEAVYDIIRDKRVFGGYCAKHKDTGVLYEILSSLHIGRPLII